MSKWIIGIDPGNSGAMALIKGDSGLRDTAKLSTATEADIAAILMRWKADGAYASAPLFAYLERVHAMPKQGVASTFKFGQSYGFLRGCLVAVGIPFEEVTPAKWQRALGCLSKGDKNVTKAKAQQLFPGIKVTHAIADALLIAEYGRRLRGGTL